jgi:hypothetical protein
VMYVVASEIVKTVAGISWDDFLKPECLINWITHHYHF